MSIATAQDPRLLGITSLAFSEDLLAGVSPDRRTLVAMTTPAGGPVRVLGESATMTAEPVAVVTFAGWWWVVAADGNLRKYTRESVPVLTQTITARAWGAGWLTVCGSFLACQIGHGGILVLNSAGTEVDRLEGAWDRIERACANAAGDRLYLFDGRGNCRVLSVSVTGLLAGVGDVQVPNAVQVRGCVVDGTALVAITDRKLLRYSLAAPDVPVLTSSTNYTADLRAVCVLVAGKYFLASRDGVALQDFQAPGEQRTAVLGNGLHVGQSHTARMSGETAPTDWSGVAATLAVSVASKLNRVQFNGEVRCLLVIGSTLYVGGAFTSVVTPAGTYTRSLVCAFDLTTGLISTTWAPTVAGGGATVECMVADPDASTDVCIGGSFETVNAITRRKFASVSAAGLLTAFDPNVNDTIHAMVVGPGTLHISIVGAFSTVDGNPHVYAAQIRSSNYNASWTPTLPATPYGIAYNVSNTSFYVIGNGFTRQITGGTASAWEVVNAAVHRAIAISAAGIVYVGARVTTLETSERNGFGASSLAGTLAAFNPIIDLQSANGIPFGAVASVAGGILLGGDFLVINGVLRPLCAMVTAAGVLVAWDPALANNGAYSRCNAFASYGTQIIMAGRFTNPAGGINLYIKDAP